MNILKYWTKKTLERQTKRAQLACDTAITARQNWHAVTRPLIEEAGLCFRPALHQCYVVPTRSPYGVQILAAAHRLLPPSGGQLHDYEEPAALVYSLHPNGQVLVLGIPHRSSHARLSEDEFVLDMVPAASLAGAAGSALVERHLDLFMRLCLASMAEAALSRSAGKFVEKLKVRGTKYKNIYSDNNEHRKQRNAQEINLGIGLAGGLMASTLLPMLPEVGKWSNETATMIRWNCAAAQDVVQCQSVSGHALFSWLGQLNAPVTMMIGAALVVVSILFVKRLLAQP